MAYRKIEVDGMEYQYVVGRMDVKVRGLDVVSKNLITGSWNSDDSRTITITPAMVADYIRRTV